MHSTVVSTRNDVISLRFCTVINRPSQFNIQISVFLKLKKPAIFTGVFSKENKLFKVLKCKN